MDEGEGHMAKNDDTQTVDDSNVRRNAVTETTPESQGPQVFTKEQLPDPAVAKAAGIPAQSIPADQIVDGEDAYSHPRGPEPGEQARAEQRRAVIDRLVENDDIPNIAAADLTNASVDVEATTALGRAIEKREAGDESADDADTDEAGREIDPEDVQADSAEIADNTGQNDTK
jgi:hypothetical protein